MPDVASLTEASWGTAAPVASGQLDLLWGFATLVTSLGGTYTPGAAPPGSTPTAPNTDADFVIPASSIYRVVHEVTVIDLRDDSAVEFESMSLSCDDGSVCWTLSATGETELFQRLTTGEAPVLEITIDGNVWRFIVEGVRRSRSFQGSGVDITGRSITITAGEPYQYPENWVNAGPATAQQIMTQAQIYAGLEIDWQIEDWLVPDRAWSFSGTPLGVVQRVAESVGAVLRSDRVENRISVLPRYRLLPNEWREAVPEVEIHIDAAMTDSWERADRPSYNGVFVSGRVDGAIALIYLAGTSGERLAPMVTDDLLTDLPALRQRGEAVLGAGGPQAVIQMTLPVLNDAGFPGVFEINWLCRIVEPGRTWYGVVRAVSVNVNFPSVQQTITLEHHTADIDGTIVPVPPTPTPEPTPALGWRDPINSATPAGVSSAAGSHTFNFATTGVDYYGVHSDASTATPTTWALTWIPATTDPAPTISVSSGSGGVVTLTYPVDVLALEGVALLTPSVGGSPLASRLRMVSTTNPGGETSNMAWSVEPNP